MSLSTYAGIPRCALVYVVLAVAVCRSCRAPVADGGYSDVQGVWPCKNCEGLVTERKSVTGMTIATLILEVINGLRKDDGRSG